MMNLSTPRPCHTRSDDQHSYLAGIIGVEVDTEAGGLIGRCRVQAAIVTDGGNVTASYSVPSDSDPDLWYVLARTDKGNLFCACPGFSYRGGCKHLDCCEEAPADVLLARQAETGVQPTTVEILDVLVPREPQPFKPGDYAEYRYPISGAVIRGTVVWVRGERVGLNYWDARKNAWQRDSFSIANLAAAIEPVDRAARAYGDLFDAA
jgi:hypothetical protein